MAALLLLPGMDGTSSLRSDFAAALAPAVQTTVVAYPPDRPLDYSELEVLARAKIPQTPFVLVGESFSGPIAIALAASHPAGLRGLVLVGSFARSPIALPRVLRWVASFIPAFLMPSRLIVALLLGRTSSLTIRNRLLAAISSVSPAVCRTRFRSVLSADVIAYLSGITVPVLYLRGAGDRVVPRRASEVFVRANPGTRIIELEGPHFILAARPVESAIAIKNFMREVGFAF